MRVRKQSATENGALHNGSSSASRDFRDIDSIRREWWKGFASALVLVAAVGWIQSKTATLSPRAATLSGKVVTRTSKEKTPLLFGLFNSSKQARIEGKPDSFPPLSRLIETGLDGTPSAVRRGVEVDWLLDFAVLGFPKCGTTTLMQSLDTPDDAAVFQEERCALGNDNVARLVWQLLENDSLPRDPHFKRGIKCPKDLESPSALRNLAKYFPTTKLIVTVRHPVLWFEVREYVS